MNSNQFDVIVIGAGPAGLTAGMYLARAKANALILSSGMAGGQMVLTHLVENYPGVESTSGYMLSATMKKQAENFGCTIKTNVKIAELGLDEITKIVKLANGEEYTTKAIILATGGKSRELGVSGEKEFSGKGISYCATCDGDFFQDKEIIVVGGGNSALEEAVSLTKNASKVTIVHQFDHFQGYKHAIEAAQNHPKIDFILNSNITSFRGNQSLESVTIENLKTNKKGEKSIDGVFIFIGYVPQTEMVKNIVNLNQWGEIIVDEQMRTNVEGVFAAGDSRQTKVRQITTAVSDGTVAALSALEYLQH